jgi:hypothetical protein
LEVLAENDKTNKFNVNPTDVNEILYSIRAVRRFKRALNLTADAGFSRAFSWKSYAKYGIGCIAYLKADKLKHLQLNPGFAGMREKLMY